MKPIQDCHPERSEGSLSGERSFAPLRMTKREGLLFEMYCPSRVPCQIAGTLPKCGTQLKEPPKMATKLVNAEQFMHMHGQEYESGDSIGCSVGIMAYNEEANIERTLHAVLAQQGPSIRIEEVIVVASGCTDRTVPLVAAIARQETRVRLFVQEQREGKASAINLFLKQASSQVTVLIGADVIPEAAALESLCAPFKDPAIGMVGGRPVPVNDASTFMGHAVHLLWRLHDRVARVSPKLGEIIAFRNVISGIPTNSAVDEISI